MDKHWYVITDDKDDSYNTTDRLEAKRAAVEGCIVTEVKEQDIFMENGHIKIIIRIEMK